MRIYHNIPAMQSNLRIKQSGNSLYKSSTRLSTGMKINSAKDDAAGQSVANKLSMQVMGIDKANQNTLDGISIVQTADGALGEIQNMIQRMRELAVQSANGTLTDDDRDKIQSEIDQLLEEVDETAKKTTFNGIPLLYPEPDPAIPGDKGTLDLILQVGADKDMEMVVNLERINVDNLGLSTFNTDLQDDSMNSIKLADDAISYISKMRANLGAINNRLESNAINLESMSENLNLARSRIEDTDMAKEMTAYTQNSVISQAATSILAQANQRPQQILQLLN